jgi:putative intracellular protease/amidase
MFDGKWRARFVVLICGGLLSQVMVGCKNEQLTAYAEVKDEVKSTLRAPFTAVFSKPPETYLAPSSTIIVKGEGCRFDISGHVDSENSFGAMLRTNFSAKTIYDKATEEWRVYELITAPN